MDEYIFNFSRYKTALLLAMCAVVIACSKKEPESASSQSSSGTTATAEATSEADGNLEFYTDRYLAADDRLKRRQRRIDNVLSGQ